MPPSHAEIKVLVPEEHRPAAERALGLSAGEVRPIWFFEAAGGAFYQTGLILRARVKKKEAELTLKLRPAPAEARLARFAGLEDFRLEVDAGLHSRSPTARISSRRPLEQLGEVLWGRSRPEALFNGDQLALGRLAEPPPWSGLLLRGPIRSEKWELPLAGTVADKLDVERWTIGEAHLLELSFRVKADQERAGMELMLEQLQSRGLPRLDGGSKTAAALRLLGALPPAG